MRKSLAAIAGLVLLLGACTTAGTTDTTALQATTESAVATVPTPAPQPTIEAPATSVAPTTTVAPPTATTTTVPRTTAPPVVTTKVPEPVLTEQAALTDVTITMTSPQSGEGPIAIWVEDPGDLPIQVTLSALATPDPLFDSFLWSGTPLGSFFAAGNPNVQSFDLTIAGGQQSQLYTITATASGEPNPLFTADSIEILLTYNSDLTP